MTGPFFASLASLPRQEGASIRWKDAVAAPEGFGLDMIGVPKGADLDIDLMLTSVSEGVLVTGTVEAPVVGQCSRCLTEISEHMRQSVSELVFYPERRDALVAQGDEDVAEAPLIVEEQIDLEPIVRDAVVLTLPFTPLCREDCPGLCPQCGVPFDELPADHDHGPAYDPRFDALAGLEAQLKESGE